MSIIKFLKSKKFLIPVIIVAGLTALASATYVLNVDETPELEVGDESGDE